MRQLDLLTYLMRQGRDSQPRTAQPGIGVNAGTLHISRPEGGAGMSGRAPAQPQGEISLQCMPGQAPPLARVVHKLSLIQAAWPTGSATGAMGTCSRNLGQSIRRNCPFMSSTNDVQLSTQSPSLQYRTPLMSRISARWM